MSVLGRRMETDRRHVAGVALLAMAYLLSFYASPIFGEYKDPSPAEEDAGVPPRQPDTIESRYFTIRYGPGADLDRIARRLKKKMSYFGVNGAYGGTVGENIAGRVDALLVRAKDILDMHPKMPRLEIRIFADREGLGDEYRKIFGETKKHRSFYVHKKRTIYTSETDISDSVIAHEMAHAIIDHYFAVVPSAKTSEVLASYVDLHLGD